MKCYLCGSDIPEGAGMCNVCGAPVVFDQPAGNPVNRPVADQSTAYNPQPTAQQTAQQTPPVSGYPMQGQPMQGQMYANQSYARPPYVNTQVYPQAKGGSGLRTGALFTGIISCLLCIVSIFLPFFTVSAFGVSKSVALSAGSDGWIVVGLAAAALLVVIFARNSRGIGHIIFGILLCAMAFIDGVKNKSDFDSSRYGNLINYGIGFYILLFASIALIVSGILLIVAKQKDK